MPRLLRKGERMVARQNQWSPFPKQVEPFRFPEWRTKKVTGHAIVRKIRPPCQIPKITPYKQWPIITGDLVEVMVGPDTGKQGKVRAVARLKNQLKVVGMNVEKQFISDKGDGVTGFVLTETPLHYTDVKLVNPITGRGTDVTLQYNDEGEQIRVCNYTKHVIPKPEYERSDFKDRSKVSIGKLDTVPDIVGRHTYLPSLLLFHEEIMKEMNIPMSIPKTQPERRDLIMKEIEDDVLQANAEEKKLEPVAGDAKGLGSQLQFVIDNIKDIGGKMMFWKK